MLMGGSALYQLSSNACLAPELCMGLAQGYPSIGDVQSTVPVPREKWCGCLAFAVHSCLQTGAVKRVTVSSEKSGRV
jgi:hypothetical protein